MKKEDQIVLSTIVTAIRDYNTALLTAKSVQKKHIDLAGVLGQLRNDIGRLIGIPDDDNCSAYVTQLEPLANAFYVQKVKVLLEVRRIGGTCDLEKEPLTIKYFITAKGEPKQESRVVTLDESKVKYERVNNQDDIRLVTFDVVMEGEENRAEISYSTLLKTIKIIYQPWSGVNLSTPDDARRTIKTLSPFRLTNKGETIFLNAFPEMPIQTESNRKYFMVKPIEDFFLQRPITPLDETNQSSIEFLTAEKEHWSKRLNRITNVRDVVKKQKQQYIDIAYNYTGADKDRVFGQEYNKKLNAITAFIEVLENRIIAINTHYDALNSAINELKPKSGFGKKGREVKAYFKTVVTTLTQISERYLTYDKLDYSYEEWKAEIENTRATLNGLEMPINKKWNELEGMSRENNQDEELYTKLKQEHKELVEWLNSVASNTILSDKEKVLQRLSDSFMEWESKEDNYNQEEKKEFKKKGWTLGFEESDKDLFDDKGANVDDIQQGSVGDCYLLSALANLANEEEGFLLRNMIKEIKGKYHVTLYQSGIPITVEVDKHLMVNTRKKDDGKDINFIGANPVNDLWVPIIEKAYAKLVAKGDFTDTKVDGGDVSKAMQVLLGNKVEVPKLLYINDMGTLVDQDQGMELQNPIDLKKISVQQLEQLILSAKEEGYKMNFSSIDKVEGMEKLTDEYSIMLSDKQYLVLNHVYAFKEFTSNQLELFNPHGEGGVTIYILNEKVAKKMKQLQEVTERIKNKKIISDSDKGIIDRLLQDDMMSVHFTNVLRLWKGKLQRNWIDKTEQWQLSDENHQKNLDTFTKMIEEVLNSDIGKGMSERQEDIKPNLELDYIVLQKYFSTMSLTKLRR